MHVSIVMGVRLAVEEPVKPWWGRVAAVELDEDIFGVTGVWEEVEIAEGAWEPCIAHGKIRPRVVRKRHVVCHGMELL